MTIRDSLAQVQELLGRATPGDWRYAHVEAPKSWAYIEAGYQQGVDICNGSNWSRRQHAEGKRLPGVDDDFKAIAAAVNFLRTHGPELMKMLEERDD